MKYGAIKDPYSARDYPAAALLRGAPEIHLPEAYQCRKSEPIMNQGGTSQCVAYGMTLIRRLHELVEVGKYPDFDTGALYARCKANDGIPLIEGTYPRIALDIMLHNGMPIKGYESPGLCFMQKSNFHPGYKIGGYWRITNETDNQIKQIIYQFGAISAACTWYTEWCNAMDGQGILKAPVHQEGGHNWVISGWDRSGWRVCNSWGLVWGISGVAYMPFSMFREVVLPEGDVWKLVDTITMSEVTGRLYGVIASMLANT
jgi:hypothetical protein